MSNIIDSIRLSGTTYQIQGEITVDVALDSGSTNPVANSAITTALDDKVNVVDNEVPQFTTQGNMLTRYYPASGTPETVFANMPVKMKVMTSGYDPRRINDIIYINDENGFVASGNCSGSSGVLTPGIPSELQPYLTVRGLYEGLNNLFEAKKGYRISYVDATMTDGDGKFEPGITPYFLVYEGGQSADVIKDVIEPTLINKQDQLVSGTNIKTINNTSILGSGNIDIQGGSITVDTELDSGSTNPVQNKVIYNKIDEVEQVTAAGLNALNSKITPTVELTQAQYDALVSAGTVSADTYYIITDAQAGDLTNYYTKSETNTLLGGKANTATTYTKTEVDTALNGKQATLVSGTNIKTINNESILGSGNIDIQGGGVDVVQTTGTSTTDVMSQDAVTTQLNNKANKTAAFGGYKFGSVNNTNYLQYVNVNNDNKGNSIYYPTINGKGILTNNSTWAQNNYNFQLVETSAITTSVTSSSTDAQVPSAKAVYDAIQEGGGGTVDQTIISGSTNAVAGGAVYNKIDEVEQVTAAGLNALNDNFGGMKLVKLTQAEYNALATKDSTTLYIIVN